MSSRAARIARNHHPPAAAVSDRPRLVSPSLARRHANHPSGRLSICGCVVAPGGGGACRAVSIACLAIGNVLYARAPDATTAALGRVLVGVGGALGAFNSAAATLPGGGPLAGAGGGAGGSSAAHSLANAASRHGGGGGGGGGGADGGEYGDGGLSGARSDGGGAGGDGGLDGGGAQPLLTAAPPSGALPSADDAAAQAGDGAISRGFAVTSSWFKRKLLMCHVTCHVVCHALSTDGRRRDPGLGRRARGRLRGAGRHPRRSRHLGAHGARRRDGRAADRARARDRLVHVRRPAVDDR